MNVLKKHIFILGVLRMSEIVILVGLMGSGKTTLAKEFNYEYINFDFHYHKMIQKEHIINPPKDIPEFLNYISDIVNESPDENFVVDNWFKWNKDWWKVEEDNTLQQLKKLLKHHEIKIIYLFTPFKLCYERYIKKHKEAGTMIQENYKETMEERQKNLLDKISKWGIQ